jgi:Tfp pilus assembly protein PilF/ADP-heptose:LPS heptosyltransferase/SAM-dependent methyltransferase
VEYRATLKQRPEDTDTLNNLAVLLGAVRRHEESRAAFLRAIEIRPDFAAAWCNLGNVVREMGLTTEAEEAYRKAIELDPKFTDAKLNLGLLLLTVGRYADAWPWHEARHFPDSKARRAMQPPFSFPQWQGESLAGKSLAVVLEQGHGDNIQFIRYAPLIKALGATRVTFVQPAPLVWFLATADGVDAITPDAVSLPAHDYWCFPLSLPMHLGTTVDSIPATLPYLRALPDRVEHWRTRLPASGLKIGLVWKGNPDHKNDANRSLPHLSTLAPLWKVPGISFISLQKGQGEDQGRQPPPGQPLLHLGDDITDFADTAAIIAQLDLLITVDSAAAHVAGALGKPVWVLLPGVGTDWRWLLDRNDSPWYPGVMRLFRQLREAASWEATVLDIATALRTWSVVPPAPTLPLFQGRFPELPAALLAPATPKPAPAVEVSSAAAEALLQAAHAAYLAGNHDEAESRLHELLVQEPANSAAWNNLASLLTEAGKPAEAEAAYLKAIAFNPAFPDFHVNFAGFLKAQNRPADAETEFREAIALRHDDVNSHNNLGILLLDAARPDAAETSFRSAISIDPNFPEAWNNLGTALQNQQRHAEAEAAYRKAIALNEEFAVSHGNLANSLHAQRKLIEAEGEYRRALDLDPGSSGTHWNLAVLLLSQGRWSETWSHFDHRNDPFRQQRNDKFRCPEWRGESLLGKSLLIDTVEGQGDNIMCARYIPLLKQAGATRITLLHKPSLKALLETVDGVDTVISDPDALPPHDYWCFSFGLLIRFHATPENVPAPIPYVFPLESRLTYWRRRLATVDGFRIGLVWKGDPKADVDRDRSLPHLSILAPLWDVPGISFVSLQKGQGEDEALSPPPNQPILHLGGDIADFADTAAIVSLLDLLITVDTAAAHVAGAAGRPVWLILPHPGEWRWLEPERNDTPWYPGVMRLFRQSPETPGWEAAITKVAAALVGRDTVREQIPHAPSQALAPLLRAIIRPEDAAQQSFVVHPNVPGVTSISMLRRVHDSRFATRYFRGDGIDVGGGSDSLTLFKEFFPLVRNLFVYDQTHGDGQLLDNVADESFDFLYSSHCLEHLRDPQEALANWLRVVRRGGHLVIQVPDEDLYEQGVWPSRFNNDHKLSFTIAKDRSWSPVSVNVLDLIRSFCAVAQPISIQLIDQGYRYHLQGKDFDQTRTPTSEAGIEVVLRKHP